jgi:deoxyribodipyrimidine photo-lyase
MTSILWLRQDLRLHDQAALVAAAAEGAVIPVYVLDDETPGPWAIGGAQRWWLHHSLAALDKALRAAGSRLVLRRGRAEAVLTELAEAEGAPIHAIRHAEPWWAKVERQLGDRLTLHDGNQLVPLDSLRTGSGSAFKVYSAFWRALSAQMPPPPACPAPKHIEAPKHWPKSERLEDWDLLPTKPDWSTGFGEAWTPGEAEAFAKAKAFSKQVGDYAERRDLPAEDGTSRLSPHLHHGEISSRTLWHALEGEKDADKFRKELAWRDFAAELTLAMPDYGSKNGRAAFDRFTWRKGAGARNDLHAWQRGRTGYPIVDAGMRQLWTMGWMHNRVRMITASFLVKHLLIDWREGERWFWDTLVDADYGNNSVNWQWIAGTGVDSNMFSRIMAPLTQSEKFDAGDYIRRWVPELRNVSDAAIHDPDAAGCRPSDYPVKIIGHREARERALAAYREARA